MTNNKELLLVHTSMYNVKLRRTVNVMLTPQFYTIKKEALPVKYAYQAKRIAPSLFDGLLDEEGQYDYYVFREKIGEEEQWVFIAYDMEKIVDFLERKGVDISKVAKIFFAQQSMPKFREGFLGLDDTNVMTVIDDVAVVVPRIVLAGETNSLHLTNAFTPETAGVRLKTKPVEQSALISSPQTFSLVAIFLLFAGMFAVEGTRYSGDAEAEKVEMEDIYATREYLRSTYNREDALEKYKSRDSVERKKRDAIKMASSMIFKGVTLTELKIEKGHFISRFECESLGVSERIKNLFAKHKSDFLTIKGGTVVVMEGKL